MTAEQIENTDILEFINRDDFYSLTPYYSGKEYWEITFLGKDIGGGLYEFEGSKSPHKLFRIFKPVVR